MRGSILILGIALVFPLSISGVTASFHDPDDFDHTFEWRAPAESTGDMVIRYTVDFGGSPDSPNHCFRMQEYASVVPANSLYFMGVDGNGGVTAGWSSQVAHAHMGPVDTHTITDGASGGFGLRSSSISGVHGVHTVTQAVFGGAHFDFQDDPWGPLAFEIACEDPFTISGLSGSTEALGFTHQDLEGTSASVYGLFAAASLTLGGTSGTFTTDSVTGAVLESGGLAGELRFTNEDEETSHTLGGGGFGTYQVDGPGGPWSVDVERVAAGSDFLAGFLGGLDEVEDLDDIFE